MDHDDEYAPAVFAREPEVIAAGLTEKDLEAAMHRLLKAGRIEVDENGYLKLVEPRNSPARTDPLLKRDW